MTNTPKSSFSQGVNLTNCDREPIHIIAKSQAHGVIVVCHPETLTVVQISDNSEAIIGYSHEKLLNQSLKKLLSIEVVEKLQYKLAKEETLLPETIEINGNKFTMIPNFSGESLLLDIEPSGETLDPLYFQEQLTKILNEIDAAETITEMCQKAVSLVKEIFGYDRVMMYQFDETWNGEVVAEAKEERLQSWLGLHYPATDIPKPAREIFLKQGVRMISDVHYSPAPLLPELSPINGNPLDLSKSELRGVSPIHIEYLKNMEVGASLTAAITLNGELWGLLACHHYQAKFVNYHQRQSCKFLTQVFSNKLALKTTTEFIKKVEYADDIRKKLVLQMISVPDINRALTQFNPNISSLIACSGAAVCIDKKLRLVGKTPSEKQVKKLIKKVLIPSKEKIFSTKQLSAVYPKAEEYKAIASGVLSIRIGEAKGDFVLWFRPEVSQTVNWGGNPEKQGYIKDGIEYLNPRKSFEKWTQNVAGVAIPWENYDKEAVTALQESITHVLVKKQKDKIKELNDRLVEANQELETFSYSVSHDLRAPLRGIEGYAKILQDHYQTDLDEYGKNALTTIIGSAEEMDRLIEDFLSYAKVGQLPVNKQVFSMQELVKQVITLQNPASNYPNTAIVVQENLPDVHADRRLISQVMNNLISNALKYSEKVTHPTIEIGSNIVEGEVVYYVKDNGIGFDPSQKESVFDVFSRLESEDYTGSGIGLSIAKKVIDKHHGTIWVETQPNHGTTFYFTLIERV